MSDMIGISSNAISAYQRALSTVSNNIANVNTEGYSKQDVVLKDSAPQKFGSNYMGTGVILQRIKRQFDDFAESNLRKSISDVSNQKPLVDYTKRVVDIMADKTVGLSSALDDFFSSAGSLSADPASTVLRSAFIRSTSGVTSRFAEISKQVDLVKTEVQEGLKSVAGQINTLTSQLGLINKSLTYSPDLQGQPNELLDRRDLTLRQLSDLVGIKVSFSFNGMVSVSLGTTMKEGLVVDGINVKNIGVRVDNGNAEVMLDPYGTPETLPQIGGGQIGGYQSFIKNALEPVNDNLNHLAQTFVNEVNTVQKNGIDGYGQMGQDLLRISPEAANLAAGIQLKLDDGLRVATGAQFRVSEGNTNVTTTRASVKYTGTQNSQAISNKNLVNNPSPSSAVTFKVSGFSEFAPITTVAAGIQSSFFLDASKPGQHLQVMTRDGRQLLGRALTETEKYQMLKPENGFASQATYSDQYLNKVGADAYRGLDLFYGAKESVKFKQKFDSEGMVLDPTPVAAQMVTGRIIDNLQELPAGAIVLNNVEMPKFQPSVSPTVKDMVGWINGVSTATITTLAYGNSPNFQFAANINGKDYLFEDLGLDHNSNPVTNLDQLADELQYRFNSSNPKPATYSTTQGVADIVPGDGTPETTTVNFSDMVKGEQFQVGGLLFTASTNTTAADVAAVFANRPIQKPVVTTTTQGVPDTDPGDGSGTPETTVVNFGAMVAGERFQVGGLTFTASTNVAANQVAALFAGKASGYSIPAPNTIFAADGTTPIGKLTGAMSASWSSSVVNPLLPNALTFTNSDTLTNPDDLVVLNATDYSVLEPYIVYGLDPTIPIGKLTGAMSDHWSSSVVDLTDPKKITFTNDNTTTNPDDLVVLNQTQTLSIEFINGSLILTDPMGGEIKNVSLKPRNPDFGGSTGKLTVSNSNFIKTGVRATAFSEIRASSNQIDLFKKLKLNGTEIIELDAAGNPRVDGAGLPMNGFSTINNLVLAINANTSITGLTASLRGADLIISDPTNQPITVDSVGEGNALTIAPGVFNPQVQLDKVVRDLVISSGDIDFACPLEINQINIFSDAKPTSLNKLMELINSKESDTGVFARLNTAGDLVLTTTDLNARTSISVGPPKSLIDKTYPANALGLEPLDYDESKRLELKMATDPDFEASIRISFGSYSEGYPPVVHNGDPSQFAQFGLRTGVYMEGACPDDLLVFVTGKGNAKVSASYEGVPTNMRDSLRSQSLQLTFTAPDRYTISDAKTGTELANRTYDPNTIEPLIEFEGLQIKLSHAPSVGDSYRIDGNQDGLGNNVNMLDMVALAKKPVDGDKTLHDSYIDQINTVGNLAQQANITLEALQVVKDQAESARDKVSGVNLDDEAASLIRYQQAYQAAAKALQVGSQLFDTIVQIR